MALIEQLGLTDARLVALCGAGGKTSLLYALGREWHAQKKKVVLTTTTHILAELPEDCFLWDGTCEGDLYRWNAGYIPVAGRPAGDRLKGPSEAMWETLRGWWGGRIVVEADGAARYPVKYPAVWEPAIPQYTDRVLVLAGLSALGRPLGEVCHRAALAVEKGVLEDGPLTEEGLAALLLRGYGRYDPLFVLNQADDGETCARGEAVAAMLRAQGCESVILSLKNGR